MLPGAIAAAGARGEESARVALRHLPLSVVGLVPGSAPALGRRNATHAVGSRDGGSAGRAHSVRTERVVVPGKARLEPGGTAPRHAINVTVPLPFEDIDSSDNIIERQSLHLALACI